MIFGVLYCEVITDVFNMEQFSQKKKGGVYSILSCYIKRNESREGKSSEAVVEGRDTEANEREQRLM